MTEAGMLSIVRRGMAYQVHYASFNPHDLERQPYPCPDEGTLVALLHHYGLEPSPPGARRAAARAAGGAPHCPC
jgi:hypothetical protein